jgi:hypothetical protein
MSSFLNLFVNIFHESYNSAIDIMNIKSYIEHCSLIDFNGNDHDGN